MTTDNINDTYKTIPMRRSDIDQSVSKEAKYFFELYLQDGLFSQYEITRSDITIGRDANNALAIPQADNTSRIHAKLSFDEKEDSYLIEDLDSKNGVFVNKKKVSSHLLKPDDLIQLGDLKLVFKVAKAVN